MCILICLLFVGPRATSCDLVYAAVDHRKTERGVRQPRHLQGLFHLAYGEIIQGRLPITSLLLLSHLLLHWSTPSQPRNAAAVAVALNDSHMETCLTLLL
jgi:hypothetical protein